MLRHKQFKERKDKPQDIVRDFKGYIKNILYRSEEYQNIMNRKVLLSFKGFKSHPEFFDVMVKEGKHFYIGDVSGFIPLNI